MTDHSAPDDPELTRRIDVPDAGTTDAAADRPASPRPTARARRSSATPRPPSRDPTWSRHEPSRHGPDPRALVRAGPGARPRPRRRGRRRPAAERARSGAGTIARRRAPVGRPRLGRHGPRPQRDGRARPAGAVHDRRPGRPSARPSRSPSTSPRRPSTSRPRSARPSSGSRSSGTPTPNLGVIPETGVGSGVIYDTERLDPHQPPRRRGQRQDDGRAQGRPRASRARSTASTR